MKIISHDFLDFRPITTVKQVKKTLILSQNPSLCFVFSTETFIEEKEFIVVES